MLTNSKKVNLNIAGIAMKTLGCRIHSKGLGQKQMQIATNKCKWEEDIIVEYTMCEHPINTIIPRDMSEVNVQVHNIHE